MILTIVDSHGYRDSFGVIDDNIWNGQSVSREILTAGVMCRALLSFGGVKDNDKFRRHAVM